MYVSYIKLGDVKQQMGDTEGALTFYEASLEISQRLAAADPTNTRAQRSLSYSYNNLGDIKLQLGDTQAALTSYQAALEIRQRLAATDPMNTRVQRSLSYSYNRLGRVQEALEQPDAAMKFYQDGLSLAQTLAEKDPSNQYIRNVIEEFEACIARLQGDEQLRQNQPDAALALYGKSIEISARLVKIDAGNWDALRDLHIGYRKAGQAHETLKDPKAAGEAYKQAYTILGKFAHDPQNQLVQHELKLLRQLMENCQP